MRLPHNPVISVKRRNGNPNRISLPLDRVWDTIAEIHDISATYTVSMEGRR